MGGVPSAGVALSSTDVFFAGVSSTRKTHICARSKCRLPVSRDCVLTTNLMGATMTMKTILIPTENDRSIQSALETALLLARRCDSYVEGFALRWGISELVGVDVVGVSLKTYKQDIPEEAEQSREMFESFMQTHDVPRSRWRAGSLSFGWLDDAPAGDSFVGSYGRVFDVIVMSRSDGSSAVLHNRAIESGLFESGRPILLSTASPPRQIATHVLVAWNCSTTGTRHCSRHVASSAGQSRDGLDSHW